jgi:hypothetical protein
MTDLKRIEDIYHNNLSDNHDWIQSAKYNAISESLLYYILGLYSSDVVNSRILGMLNKLSADDKVVEEIDGVIKNTKNKVRDRLKDLDAA